VEGTPVVTGRRREGRFSTKWLADLVWLVELVDRFGVKLTLLGLA
jgi:hypothetical protein